MGAFIDSLPKNTGARGPGGSPNNQAAYTSAVLDAVQRGTHDPISWSYITISGNGRTVKLAVFSKPMTFEGVYLPAGAGLLQQIADVLGCSLLTPKIQDTMYAQAGTRVLPWLDYDDNRMGTVEWFKRATVGMGNLLQAAGYSGGLVMGMGKPFQLDNDLLTHPGRAENYGLYVPASACPGGRYGGVTAPPTLTLPPNQVRCLQGYGGWAHGLDQSDYSELVSLVSRNCEVDGRLTDLVDVLQDPVVGNLLSHNGPLRVVRQPGVPIVQRRGQVGGMGPDGRDGKTAAPFQLTGLPPEGPEKPPAPMPAPVPAKYLEPEPPYGLILGGVAAALAAGYGVYRWTKRKKR